MKEVERCSLQQSDFEAEFSGQDYTKHQYVEHTGYHLIRDKVMAPNSQNGYYAMRIGGLKEKLHTARCLEASYDGTFRHSFYRTSN